jgi:hypothetical protein
MKKNHGLLLTGLVFFGLIAGSCTKDNTQPTSYTKKPSAVTVSQNTGEAAAGQTPSTPPPSEAISSGGCTHPH